MEQTTCDYGANPSVKAFNCEREEQCDDCFMVDHLKECKGCEEYEHGFWTFSAACQHKMLNSTAKLCDTCVLKTV